MAMLPVESVADQLFSIQLIQDPISVLLTINAKFYFLRGSSEDN